MERALTELKAVGDQLQSRADQYESKIHNTTIAYLVAGRFFFAIPRSSQLTCKAWWVTFTLCALSTFIYLLFLIDTAFMLYRVEHQMDVIYQSQAELCRRILLARKEEATAVEIGGDCSSSGVEMEVMMMLTNSCGGYRRGSVERKVYMGTILWAMLAVAALDLYASNSLLCD